MSKNFFEQASDELTQDSFIAWLVSNTEDEEIGEISREFLSFLWDEGHSLKPNKIHIISVDRQYKKIDLIINFNYGEDQYCLIVEDKTNSTEHSGQLVDYSNIVNGWKETKNGRPTKFVYYKTGYIVDQDNKGREGTDFRLVDLEKIYNFFKDKKSDSEILNHYIEHIKNQYLERHDISNAPIKKWTFENLRTFISKEIEPKYNQIFDFCYGIYTGRYLSAMIYFKNNDSYSRSTCLEIFFRNNDSISAVVHPYTPGENKSWRREHDENFYSEVSSSFNKKLFKSYRKCQTVATLKDNINKTNIEEVGRKLIEIINDYKESFERFNINKS